MASIWRALTKIIRRTRPSSRERSTFAHIIPTETPVEEETLPHYKPAHYYPVKIGDVYHTRYEVMGKLGYGAYSTSWLCRDLQCATPSPIDPQGALTSYQSRAKSYTLLKVSTCLPDYPTATDRELRVYEHLANVDSPHPGQLLIRELYDSFNLQGAWGTHRCLVLQPMDMTLLEMMAMNPRPFDLPLLRMTVRRLLLALDFLHAEAEVIHTDLKTDNLMLSLEDNSMLGDFVTAESETPSPQKLIDQSRIIYSSRKFRRPTEARNYGLPVLCDFGEARIGETQESGPFVQPRIYRAPEVIFEMPWGSAIDIWNLAGLIWDLFEGQHLFGDIFDSTGSHDPFRHLALMVALIGPPPSEFVRRSETTSQCFDSSGGWIAHTEAPVPSVSLEALEKRLGGEEKELFLAFVRSMLQWMPEERKTAKQLLEHPFLL
ncbi:protein kinase domain protein [Aspergillus bombycis]|uniref:Protein kinase domain protein n=1 Tax=Aspergillus bombycis TaxID=109264 RepID=A0A1F8AD29_9EURO|nr:protein kinase domain protein [Aspergillus bombycis]OGM49561.1 protein kinase domain protein [Aspergillus bombycis]